MPSDPERQHLSAPDKAALGLSAVQLALAGYIARFGPAGSLPMHFDLGGRVNRWGSRYEVVVALAAAAVAVFVIVRIMTLKAARTKPGDRRIATIQATCLVSFGGLALLLAAAGLGRVQPEVGEVVNMRTVIAPTFAIIAAAGAGLGKLKPNRLVGIKTWAALHSRLAWDKSHRLLGRIYFLGGLAGLVLTPLVTPLQIITVFVATVFGGIVIAVLESWRVWRRDPDRKALL